MSCLPEAKLARGSRTRICHDLHVYRLRQLAFHQRKRVCGDGDGAHESQRGECEDGSDRAVGMY